MQFIWLSTALFAVILGGQLSSCSKSSPSSSGAGGGTSGATSEIEVSGSISEEAPVDFVKAADSVSISGVNLTGNISYLVTAYSLEPNGFKKLIFTGTFLEPKFSFKSPVARQYMVIEITRLPDGGQFGAVLPPPVGSKQASLVVDGTTTIAAKMASLIATKAASGDHEAQQVLSSGTISVADILMVSQSVRTTVIEQKDQGKGSAIDLSILAANLISKSNERVSKLNAEGQSRSAIAEKLSESSYQTIFGDEAKIAPAGVLAYRVNPDLGSSEAAKITIAYEAIKASGSDSMKPVDEAFRVEATAYRTANSVTEAAAAKTQVTTDFKVVFSSCISSPSSCAQTSYTPPQPPSSSIETARAPGIPTSFTGTAGDGQVELTWAAPASNGGAAIMDYIIEYKNVSDAVWLLFADGVSINTSTVVLGLENGVSYNFRVAAKNSKGSGAYSDIINKNPLPTGCSGNGPCSTDGRYYVDGIALPGLDSAGNGYSSIVGKYYIGGLATSLSQAGNGDFNGRRYVGGQYFTGFDNGVCFVDGVSTSLVSNGKGFCDGKYYIGGLHQPGLDSSGIGQSNDGKYYVNGSLANGYVDDKTVLLLHLDGAEGSKTITDSSNVPKTSEARGSAALSLSKSKFGGASLYLDGSDGTDVRVPWDPSMDPGAEDFSIEAWVHLPVLAGPVNHNLILCGNQHGSMCFGFYPDASQLGVARRNLQWDHLSAVNISTETWYHVAVTRENGLVRLFLDGTLISSYTFAGNFSFGSAVHIGSHSDWGWVRAYIDELRITKGLARYTENFTPPQSAFTVVPKGYYKEGVLQAGLDSSGSGQSNDGKYYVNGSLANGFVDDDKTVLLMHMDGDNGSQTFTDSSASNLTITPNGNAVVSTSQSKFGGASGDFENGWATVPASKMQIGPDEDFTMEAWIKPTNGPFSFLFGMESKNYFYVQNQVLLFNGDVDPQLTGNISYTFGTWNHIAASRASGTLRLFWNGNEVASQPESKTYFTQKPELAIGSMSSGAAAGQIYIDELRITKGLARYSSNFTPPETAFAAVTKGYYKDGVLQPGLDSTGTGLNSADNKYYINGVLANGKINDGTILLLHMDGPDGSTVFTDSSFQANNVISGGLPSIRESQSKFGGASTYFDGSSHLSLNPSETLAFGNGDFTAEAWINWSGTIPASNPIHSGLQKRYSQIFGGHVVGSDADWSVLLLDDGRLYYQGIHGSPFFTSAQTLTANSWSHISVVRKNNVIKFYIDGIEDSNSVTSSQTIPSVLKFGIGGESITNTAYFQGYMDEIRLIKGRAQYSSSFTVPSEPFTNCYTNGLPRSCTSSD